MQEMHSVIEIAAVTRLREEFGRAANVVTLRNLASEARGWVRAAYVDGLGGAHATRALSHLDDALTVAVLRVVASRFRLPPAPWCWIGLGSEGRREQTLSADQDNGLIFFANGGREAEHLRAHLLPFAMAANELLAECGVPRCDGGVMAGNPEFCLSLEEWGERFSNWMRLPEPVALLNAAIAFDFRAIDGDVTLAAQLRGQLAALGKESPICQRMLVHNALQAVPPLGRLKDLVTDADADESIDIKKYGTRIFVDAARILALAHGISPVGTAERLLALSDAGVMPSAEARAAVQAYHALQGLRLESQIANASTEAGNRVVPDQLNTFSRGVLITALRQARLLQTFLRSNFRMDG